MSEKSRSWEIRKTVPGLSGLSDFLVGLPYKVLRPYGVNVVPQLTQFRDQTLGQILIELDFQRLIGASAKGRSS